MDKVKKNFGFGFMRLPMLGEEVDIPQTQEMVDLFMKSGFNYFDTAHGYISGKSELALKECLTSKYPRDSYVLVDKLTAPYFEKEEDIRPFFESQLEACGVDYFDFYLMHAQGKSNFGKFKECRAYETAFDLKKEGKIRHVGISFHDTAEVLDMILTEYPEIEVVQIQFNYVDYDDPSVQSKAVYDMCRKHGKAVIIMEPVKGGNLVGLPDQAEKFFKDLKGGSNASYAIRFAAGFEGVFMTLSGMSNLEQMMDNLSFMTDFKPLNDEEMTAIENVRKTLASMKLIQCTACKYCVDGCPQNIAIPSLFAIVNKKNIYKGWHADFWYGVATNGKGKASDCVECGLCEESCPQHLEIRKLLKDVAEEFEKESN